MCLKSLIKDKTILGVTPLCEAERGWGRVHVNTKEKSPERLSSYNIYPIKF